MKKRKSFDSVLWQKPLHKWKTHKSEAITQNATNKVNKPWIVDRFSAVSLVSLDYGPIQSTIVHFFLILAFAGKLSVMDMPRMKMS